MLRPLAFPLCLLLACSGNDVPVPAASPKAAGTPATDKSVVQPTTNSPSDPAAPATTATTATTAVGEPTKSPMLAAGGPHTGPVPGPSDPAWFKPDIFPGATVTSSGRTQKDEQGLYSTQMLLALPAGTTRDACVDALSNAASPAVPNLAQTDKDGRINLTGGNDDYSVTMLCGEGKGKMSAYLSYRWLRPPPPQPPPVGP